ncbi:MAG: DUF6159 family protein [Nanoarchaeota archaeon]
MANVFSRSWDISKLCWNVITKDKELLLFPMLAGVFSIAFILAMLFPSVIAALVAGLRPEFTALTYVLVFLTYLGLAIIATFFNVCVVFTAKVRFSGGNATFGQSIKFAFSKFHLIFYWGLVSATVGLILHILDQMAERAGGIGRLILGITRWILGAAWGMVTIFVVPGMVYNNLTPFAAIKKSVGVLKKTWGESLVRAIGLGITQFIFILIGIALSIALFFVLFPLGIAGIIVALLVAGLYFLAVFILFGVMNNVFNAALYEYADTGRIPQGFTEESVKGAFVSRKPAGNI